MSVINPTDLSKIDPDTISYITLKNGNTIILDTSSQTKPIIQKKIINFDSILKSMKNPLRISEKINIAFYGKNNNDNNNNNNNIREFIKNNQNNTNYKKIVFLKNDFNIISKITKNIYFSYYGKQKENKALDLNNVNIVNCREIFSRNNPQKNISDKIINLNNSIKKSNNHELIITNTNNKNIINYEEKKEENKINDKIIKKNRKYKKATDKIFDINKPSVNAVISLDIPSDIQYEITGIQKQFNMLRTQLKRKKNRHRKLKPGEDYQRYYELYKNPQNRVYNGTFDNRLKYFQEAAFLENENNKKDTNIFNKYNYRCSGVLKKKSNKFDFINTINFNSNKNNKNINNFNYYSRNVISDYNSKNSKNSTVNNFLKDKTKSISEMTSFREKVTRNNSAIIFPCNIYNNSTLTRNPFF